MTPKQFAAALAKTRLKPRAADAARMVLVDGLSKAEAARRSIPPLTPEAVRQAVARIESAHRKCIGCPSDWERITVCVPASEAERVREIERRARRAVD